ncbi:MAG: type I DNA topoisomerase [Dehalococcoidia bacterium]
MAKNLVIVESPAKARTIGRFLGKDYDVQASMGHVRTLGIKSEKGDIVNGVQLDNKTELFHARYEIIRGKNKVVTALKKSAKVAENVYLATDPDREGEAISWHLLEAASIGIDKVKRVVFHEITKPAIEEAFANPRLLDTDLVNAQRARQMLDKLVGFELSPILWRKIRRGLSAGRVQSVAVKAVVKKEEEINSFVKEEFWTLDAILGTDDSSSFKSSLIAINDHSEKPLIKDEKKSKNILEELSDASFQVSKFETKETKRRPSAPFITSTLQQEASRRLRISATRTMSLAQALYEGKPIGGTEEVGLITYMRTDSTEVSSSALSEISGFVKDKYGPAYLPEKPRIYSKKVQGAQEAHEAIRPTSIFRTPDSLKNFLEPDELRLYTLIWRRMLSSQMVDSIYDRTVIDINATSNSSNNIYGFRASGNVLKFDGFRVVYSNNSTDDDTSDEEKDKNLPKLDSGQKLLCSNLEDEQNFTQPPPRFTEASLINYLEKEGIGRPSTYATILSTIQARDYVWSVRGKLHPTKLGTVTTFFLQGHFDDVLDVGFTAEMEKKLDDIAEGKLDWNPMLLDFYKPFSSKVENVISEAARVDYHLLEQDAGKDCPITTCSKPLVIKLGSNGRFISCSAYPDCTHTENLTLSTLGVEGVVCPLCGGEIQERITRASKTKPSKRFYGCANFFTDSNCNYAINAIPISQKLCPDCSGPLLPVGDTRARCPSKECSFRSSLKDLGVTADQLINPIQ